LSAVRVLVLVAGVS